MKNTHIKVQAFSKYVLAQPARKTPLRTVAHYCSDATYFTIPRFAVGMLPYGFSMVECVDDNFELVAFKGLEVPWYSEVVAERELRAFTKLPEDDWRTPTSYLKRFGDALQLLCGGHRISETVRAHWLLNCSEELQQIVGPLCPSWAQAIATIDAATTMADQPTEGVRHMTLDEFKSIMGQVGAIV